MYNDGEIQIFIKWSLPTLTISCDKTDTVISFKNLIKEKIKEKLGEEFVNKMFEKHDPCALRLSFEGKYLRNINILRDYDIQNESNIYLEGFYKNPIRIEEECNIISKDREIFNKIIKDANDLSGDNKIVIVSGLNVLNSKQDVFGNINQLLTIERIKRHMLRCVKPGYIEDLTLKLSRATEYHVFLLDPEFSESEIDFYFNLILKICLPIGVSEIPKLCKDEDDPYYTVVKKIDYEKNIIVMKNKDDNLLFLYFKKNIFLLDTLWKSNPRCTIYDNVYYIPTYDS